MALTKLNAEMDHISRLSDMPQQEGIGTAELKARFDAGNRQIKEYLNAVLLPELDPTIVTIITAVDCLFLLVSFVGYAKIYQTKSPMIQTLEPAKENDT